MLTDEPLARAYVESLCDEAAMSRLECLYDLLIVENEAQNLIAKTSIPEMWLRHFADSAQLLRFVPRETSREWLDLGTGAGFPGLVIAAMRPEIPVILVESRARRVDWLKRAISELGLKNCEVKGDRLERVEPFEAAVISARAFAPLPRLLRLSAPFSTRSTAYLLPKGRSAAQELGELPKRQRQMFHVEQSLTSPDAGIIVSN